MWSQIVELQTADCEGRITDYLEQSGFVTERSGTGEVLINAHHPSLSVLPVRLEVILEDTGEATRVSVGSDWSVGMVVVRTVVCSSPGWLPLVLFRDQLHALGPVGMSALLWLLLVCGVCWWKMRRERQFLDGVQRQLWTELRGEKKAVHVQSRWSPWQKAEFKAGTVWGIILGLCLLVSAYVGMASWRPPPGSLGVSGPSPRTVLLLLVSVGAVGVTSLVFELLWKTATAELPHRFQWRTEVGNHYVLLGLVCASPLISIGIFRIMGTDGLDVIGRAVAVLGFGIAVYLFAKALAVDYDRKLGDGDRSDHLSWLPSTKYEEVSGEKTQDNVVRRYRIGMFGQLALTGVWFWAAALLVLAVLCSSLVGLAWPEAVSDWDLGWPFVLPWSQRSRAAQSLVVTIVLAWPTLLGLGALVRNAARLRRRGRLVRKLGGSAGNDVVPEAVRSYLSEVLGKVAVVTVPGSGVRVAVNHAGLLGGNYILTLSSGSVNSLDPRELEALLWHECGHSRLLKGSWYRNLLVLLCPWGPRFMDLGEDLYAEERRADEFAMQRMGSGEPLREALRKQRKIERSAEGEEGQRSWSGDFWSMLFRLDWTGHVYPTIEQRLAWISEAETEVEGDVGEDRES